MAFTELYQPLHKYLQVYPQLKGQGNSSAESADCEERIYRDPTYFMSILSATIWKGPDSHPESPGLFCLSKPNIQNLSFIKQEAFYEL